MLIIIRNYKKLFSLMFRNNFAPEASGGNDNQELITDKQKDGTTIDDLVQNILLDEKIDGEDKKQVQKLVEEMDKNGVEIYKETQEASRELMKDVLKNMLVKGYTINNENDYNTLKILLNKFDIGYKLLDTFSEISSKIGITISDSPINSIHIMSDKNNKLKIITTNGREGYFNSEGKFDKDDKSSYFDRNYTFWNNNEVDNNGNSLSWNALDEKGRVKEKIKNKISEVKGEVLKIKDGLKTDLIDQYSNNYKEIELSELTENKKIEQVKELIGKKISLIKNTPDFNAADYEINENGELLNDILDDINAIINKNISEENEKNETKISSFEKKLKTDLIENFKDGLVEIKDIKTIIHNEIFSDYKKELGDLLKSSKIKDLKIKDYRINDNALKGIIKEINVSINVNIENKKEEIQKKVNESKATLINNLIDEYGNSFVEINKTLLNVNLKYLAYLLEIKNLIKNSGIENLSLNNYELKGLELEKLIIRVNNKVQENIKEREKLKNDIDIKKGAKEKIINGIVNKLVKEGKIIDLSNKTLNELVKEGKPIELGNKTLNEQINAYNIAILEVKSKENSKTGKLKIDYTKEGLFMNDGDITEIVKRVNKRLKAQTVKKAQKIEHKHTVEQAPSVVQASSVVQAPSVVEQAPSIEQTSSVEQKQTVKQKQAVEGKEQIKTSLQKAKDFYKRMKTTPDQIKQIQTAVGVNADGKFGPNTFNAIIDYQNTITNLVVDGQAGTNTLLSMKLIKDGQNKADFYKKVEKNETKKDLISEEAKLSPKEQARAQELKEMKKDLGLTPDDIKKLSDNGYELDSKEESDYLIDKTGLLQINDVIYNLKSGTIVDQRGNVLALETKKSDLVKTLVDIKTNKPDSRELVTKELLLTSSVKELEKAGFEVTGKIENGGYLINRTGLFNTNDLLYNKENRTLIDQDGNAIKMEGSLLNTLMNLEENDAENKSTIDKIKGLNPFANLEKSETEEKTNIDKLESSLFTINDLFGESDYKELSKRQQKWISKFSLSEKNNEFSVHGVEIVDDSVKFSFDDLGLDNSYNKNLVIGDCVTNGKIDISKFKAGLEKMNWGIIFTGMETEDKKNEERRKQREKEKEERRNNK